MFCRVAGKLSGLGVCSAAIAASLAFSATAVADPADPVPSPDDFAGAGANTAAQIQHMESEGKAVHIVGAKTAPLQDCGIAKTIPEKGTNVVDVQVSCPNTDY